MLLNFSLKLCALRYAMYIVDAMIFAYTPGTANCNRVLIARGNFRKTFESANESRNGKFCSNERLVEGASFFKDMRD